MKLEIGPNIDSKTVRLDFCKGPGLPANPPSYKIEKSKADEFVKKYNTQETKLMNATNISVAIIAIVGWVTSLWKHSLKTAFIGVPCAIIAGLGLGAAISSGKKSDLMDKYGVREIP